MILRIYKKAIIMNMTRSYSLSSYATFKEQYFYLELLIFHDLSDWIVKKI